MRLWKIWRSNRIMGRTLVKVKPNVLGLGANERKVIVKLIDMAFTNSSLRSHRLTSLYTWLKSHNLTRQRQSVAAVGRSEWAKYSSQLRPHCPLQRSQPDHRDEHPTRVFDRLRFGVCTECLESTHDGNVRRREQASFEGTLRAAHLLCLQFGFKWGLHWVERQKYTHLGYGEKWGQWEEEKFRDF